LPVRFSEGQAVRLIEQGALAIDPPNDPQLLLVAIGAYQLEEALKARSRLQAAGIATALTYIVEPARFRRARDEREAACMVPDDERAVLFPATPRARVIVTHTRPEPMAGVLRPLDTGPASCSVLGYLSRGGTLDVHGMLFANRCTWAHVLDAAAGLLGIDARSLLEPAELAAVQARGDPQVLRSWQAGE